MDLRRAEFTDRPARRAVAAPYVPRRSARRGGAPFRRSARFAVDRAKLAGLLLVVVVGATFWAGVVTLLWRTLT